MDILPKTVPFNVLLLCFLASVSIASAEYAFNKPQIRVTTTFADFDARVMDQWGKGGGKFVKISNDSQHPFQERTFGGAKRQEIRGSTVFGSGYPYGANDLTTVARRPFPFGTWPLWWDRDFMGSSEYGPHLDAIRPGGLLVSVPLRTTTKHFNVTEGEVYYAIGDRESLLPLMISYVTWCHIVPAWPSKFDPALSTSAIKLENVIQYFRASSFALATPAYNNTFARQTTTAPSSDEPSTPLPESIQCSPFRLCIDNVTFNALAIMNQPPVMTPLQTFLYVLRRVWFFMFFGLFYLFALTLLVLIELRLYVWELVYPARMARARAVREREFAYENYP
ncbi:hypothetical protein FRC20_000411 [Serendipita sp. 405]|nr:hypothetical protein FRC20_000411 [Serendipita sp. 405]